MTMFYFRFPDEATATAALDAAGLLYTDDDGNTSPITASHDHALDVVGTIYEGGEYDPETGEVIEPPTQLPGWHVNYIGTAPDDWEAYKVNPTNPHRIFAGMN